MWSSLAYGYWDFWLEYDKVVFDGPNKYIWIVPGTTTINVKEDLYVPWKEWVQSNPDALVNATYLYAMRAVGGDPLPGNRYLGSTFFLSNGWRIKPYEGDYSLIVNGVLYTEEGDSPFLGADGFFNNIRIEMTVSNIVDVVGISASDIREAVWEVNPIDYENEDDTMGQEITNISSKTALIPGLF